MLGAEVIEVVLVNMGVEEGAWAQLDIAVGSSFRQHCFRPN